MVLHSDPVGALVSIGIGQDHILPVESRSASCAGCSHLGDVSIGTKVLGGSLADRSSVAADPARPTRRTALFRVRDLGVLDRALRACLTWVHPR
jgi:hypothetical protein